MWIASCNMLIGTHYTFPHLVPIICQLRSDCFSEGLQRKSLRYIIMLVNFVINTSPLNSGGMLSTSRAV